MADVLIVEDDGLQQAIIRQFLQPAHRIVGFTNTEERAVELAKRHDPNVVIMDVNLDDGDGIAAAERIRSVRSDAAIIFSTARVDEELKELARTIPAEGYLIKPYSKRELLDTIEDAQEGPSRDDRE